MKQSIKVRNISKSINGRKILKNISFDAYEGDIIGLVGENGAGKSTLMKVLTGLYKYDEGDIFYYDYNFKDNFEKCISMIGTLIEYPDMYKNLSGKTNLKIFKSMFKNIDDETIEEIVRIVEMEKLLGKKFKTYSLGMKERLAIASSLINKPKILILDEPTNGLDPIGSKNILNILKNMNDVTIIISSHILSDMESICNKIMFIKNGEIVNIKNKENESQKRRVRFDVDDYSKAKVVLNDYCINEDLEVFENEEIISLLNKKLIVSGVNVYRIYEDNNLEKEFFDMVNHDEINKK